MIEEKKIETKPGQYSKLAHEQIRNLYRPTMEEVREESNQFTDRTESYQKFPVPSPILTTTPARIGRHTRKSSDVSARSMIVNKEISNRSPLAISNF